MHQMGQDEGEIRTGTDAMRIFIEMIMLTVLAHNIIIKTDITYIHQHYSYY